MTDVPRETWLREQFAGNPGLVRFAAFLASTGVERGLIGPREVPRLWSRHVANCAVVAAEEHLDIPVGAAVADVGSGAGLPGIVWALVRPDVDVTLIEPLLRRSTFLSETVTQLQLDDRVRVIRARAEEADEAGSFDVVTARAVARLPRLLEWTVRLARVGGSVLALKGSAAAIEVAEAEPQLHRLGAGPLEIKEYGLGVVEPPTTVVITRRLW